QLADPGTGQIERSRTAQSAHADDQHAAVEQALLTLHVDLLQQNLPAVAQQLFVKHATALRSPAADHPDRASSAPGPSRARAATDIPPVPAASHARATASRPARDDPGPRR